MTLRQISHDYAADSRESVYHLCQLVVALHSVHSLYLLIIHDICWLYIVFVDYTWYLSIIHCICWLYKLRLNSQDFTTWVRFLRHCIEYIHHICWLHMIFVDYTKYTTCVRLLRHFLEYIHHSCWLYIIFVDYTLFLLIIRHICWLHIMFIDYTWYLLIIHCICWLYIIFVYCTSSLLIIQLTQLASDSSVISFTIFIHDTKLLLWSIQNTTSHRISHHIHSFIFIHSQDILSSYKSTFMKHTKHDYTKNIILHSFIHIHSFTVYSFIIQKYIYESSCKTWLRIEYHTIFLHLHSSFTVEFFTIKD